MFKCLATLPAFLIAIGTMANANEEFFLKIFIQIGFSLDLRLRTQIQLFSIRFMFWV